MRARSGDRHELYINRLSQHILSFANIYVFRITNRLSQEFDVFRNKNRLSQAFDVFRNVRNPHALRAQGASQPFYFILSSFLRNGYRFFANMDVDWSFWLTFLSRLAGSGPSLEKSEG